MEQQRCVYSYGDRDLFVGLNPSPMLLGEDVQCPLRSDSGMQKFSSSPQITVKCVVSQDLLNR